MRAAMRMVLDTNVVASGLLWRGPPRELLHAARERKIALFSSPPLLAELLDILARRKFEKQIAMSGLTIDDIVSRYTLLATTMHPASIPATVKDDPDDDHVLACAIAARADLIVSGDRHLLGLGGSYLGIRIVRPTEAVAMLNAR